MADKVWADKGLSGSYTVVQSVGSMPNLATALALSRVPQCFKSYLLEEILYLVDRLVGQSARSISQAMLQQLANEVERLGFLLNLTNYLVKAIGSRVDFDGTSKVRLQSIFQDLNGAKEFVGEHRENVLKAFQELRNGHSVSGFSLGEMERIEIVKALDGSVTKWYKCSNGHIYGIGDCGQAMVTGQCPECKETIGGQSHRLENTNREAPEMRQGLPERPQLDPFLQYVF